MNGNGNGKNGNRKKNAMRVQRPVSVSYGDSGARLRGKMESFRSENAEFFAYGTGYIDWMIDPDAQMPMRVPDDLVSTSAVFKTRTVFTLPFCAPWDATDGISEPTFPQQVPLASGESLVIALPGSNESIFHTLGAATVFIADDAKEGDHSAYPVLISEDLDTNGYMTHGLARNGLAIIPRPNTAGIPIYESAIFDVPAGNLNLTIAFEKVRGTGPSTNQRAIIGWRAGVPGAPGPFVEQDIPWSGGIDFVNFTIVNTINAFYIQVLDSDPGAKWSFSMGTQDPALFAIHWDLPLFSATAYKILNPRDLQGLERTSEERTTALSLLSSYVGTDFANGGLVAGARLPMGMSLSQAPDGDYFSFLASLPFYSDDHPLKKGQYTWWCPDSTTEFFYTPYGAPKSGKLASTSLLVQTFRRDDPNQDIRVSIVVGIEVLTRSNLYAAAVGPCNPMFAKILQFGKMLPASTENPTHKQILGGLFRKIKTQILKPANWLKFGKGVLDVFVG
jgi:hypothetical protein